MCVVFLSSLVCGEKCLQCSPYPDLSLNEAATFDIRGETRDRRRRDGGDDSETRSPTEFPTGRHVFSRRQTQTAQISPRKQDNHRYYRERALIAVVSRGSACESRASARNGCA